MVRVYTNKEYIPKGHELVLINDTFFYFTTLLKPLSSKSIEVMKLIDGAHFVPKSKTTIETPYGATSIKNLSTGCKTYINIIECEDASKVFSLNECGANVLLPLLEYFADSDKEISVYLTVDSEVTALHGFKIFLNNDTNAVDVSKLVEVL